MIKLQTENTKKKCCTDDYRDDDVLTWVYGMDNGQSVFVGKGPDNPSISDINYRIEHCKWTKGCICTCHCECIRKKIQTYKKDLSNRECYLSSVKRVFCVVQADGKKIEKNKTN